MNNNRKINDLALAINEIELNEEDILEVTLASIKSFSTFYQRYEGFVDNLLIDQLFLFHSMNTTKESIVLAIQSMILDKEIKFNELLEKCFFKEDRIAFINTSSKNNETKVFFNLLFTYLAKEAYSSTISRNKPLSKISDNKKEIWDKRKVKFDIFASL